MGTALRQSRLATGQTQTEVAAAAGVTQGYVSELERGLGASASIETWASLAAAVGLQFAAFLEGSAGADLPRDIEHLRRQEMIVRTAAPGGWTATPEQRLATPGSHAHSIDVLLLRPTRSEAVVCEVWDLLLDVGAALRDLDSKIASAPAHLPVLPDAQEWRVSGLWVVRGTRRNRRLVAELPRLFEARFPGRSSCWLRALASPVADLPGGAGLLWTDVRATRLIASRRRTNG